MAECYTDTGEDAVMADRDRVRRGRGGAVQPMT